MSQLPKNWFVAAGPEPPKAVQIVETVDDLAVGGYANIRVIKINGEAHGRYGMKVAEYDATFIERFRPARAEDLIENDLGKFRLPKNATAEWLGEDLPEPIQKSQKDPVPATS